MNLKIKNLFQNYFIFLILISFFFFYSYISSVYAGMEDSATFILMANNWGVSHPPGYPVFAILGNLFSYIPISTIPFRTHLLNIFLGIGSLYFLFRINFYFTKNFLASLIGILVFASTETFVFQTVSAEVYALYLFFSLFLIFWILEFNSSKYFFEISGILIGLSLANHWPLFILGFFSYIYLYLNFGTESEIKNEKNRFSRKLEKKKKVNPENFSNPIFNQLKIFFLNKKTIFGLCIGLAPYLHLYFARFYSEYFFYFKINSLKDFLYYILRKEQATTDVLETWRFIDSFYFLKFLILTIYNEFGFVFFILGFIGFVFSFFKNRKLFYFLLITIFSTPIFLLILWRTEFNSFTEELFRNWMLLSFAGFSICLAFLIDSLTTLGLSNIQLLSKWKNFLQSKNFNYLIYSILILFITNLFYSKIPFYSKQKNDSFSFDYAETILSTLPENSVLLVNTDEDSGSQIYIAQKYFGIRKDILMSSALGAVFPERIFERNKDDLNRRRLKLLNFISSNISKNKKIFTTKKFGIFNEEVKFPMNYHSYGPLFLVTESNEINKSDLVFPIQAIEKSKSFLDIILKNEFDKHWIRYRKAAIGNICHILLVNQMEHPIFYKEEICLRLFAQQNHVLKNYTQADELFLTLIHSQIKDSYISEKISIYKEFLINRISIFNSTKEKQISILQEAIGLTFPVISEYPVCKNQLAKTIDELSKQIPIYFDKFEFFKNFGECNF